MTDLIALSVKRSKTAFTRTGALRGLAFAACLYVPPSTGFPLKLVRCSKLLSGAWSDEYDAWDP